MQKQKVNVVTLGCSKNTVDSEYLMRQLEVDGWEVVFDSNDPTAKVVIINTCGFIADAKEESINTILSFVDAKRKGMIERIFVMGCLSQRYKNELAEEIPEVDEFFGVNDLPLVLSGLNATYSESLLNQRFITTPSHYSYLKISEGCSWGCSYCAIPLIKGRHISKPISDLVTEAKYLVKKGVKELIIIAQDSVFYGIDLYGERRLPQLVNELSKIDGLEWIRIHYAYPNGFPMELAEIMQRNPKVCKYLDIPFQHISDNVLSIMRRKIAKHEILAFIQKLRAIVPDVALRTTLLVGHPGETEADFQELLEFVRDTKFDRLGVFTYSEEEGTHSATMDNDVPEEVKQSRAEQIMEVQRGVSLNSNTLKIGKEYKIIIDRIEGEYYVGRTQYDSPEVDQEVYVPNSPGSDINMGDFVNCKITSASDYDLFAEIL
ncbi:MAG: 30S ribosomal protein S12 methylthiotransferase RimO [Bacteroidales bacterium]|nr:30S ribosomal protein S12 methylthiotransferase RimO [Bacteroidales bacterium]MDD4671858.1 30S ribosomal protein S12 methylthiotransferase RimO [Bacteroidales bacterium]MDY0348245.1 30S ribosomal protein S12 methylthiotransferase RimO [Tenuifilaceae bacterium]